MGFPLHNTLHVSVHSRRVLSFCPCHIDAMGLGTKRRRTTARSAQPQRQGIEGDSRRLDEDEAGEFASLVNERSRCVVAGPAMQDSEENDDQDFHPQKRRFIPQTLDKGEPAGENLKNLFSPFLCHHSNVLSVGTRFLVE